MLTLALVLSQTACGDEISDATVQESASQVDVDAPVDDLILDSEQTYQRFVDGTYLYDSGDCIFVDGASGLQYSFTCGMIWVGISSQASEADVEAAARSLRGTVHVSSSAPPFRTVAIAVPVGSERAKLVEAHQLGVFRWVSLSIATPAGLF
jgi:hypothetical protein